MYANSTNIASIAAIKRNIKSIEYTTTTTISTTTTFYIDNNIYPDLPKDNSCKTVGTFRGPIFNGTYSFNTGRIPEMTQLDYTVFVTIFSCTFLIGVYHVYQSHRSVTVAQFLFAYRSMSGFPMGVSTAASFVSGLTVLGTVAEHYANSTMYLWVILSLVLMAALTAQVYHPVFYKLNVKTSYQYLELRFDKNVRALAAALFIFSLFLYNSIILYAPAAALQEVTGLSLWASILAIGITCITVTALGGMRTIVWTDLFQMSVMCLSLVVVLIRAIYVNGSWQNVWAANVRANRLKLDEFRLDATIRHSVWSVVTGGFFTFCGYFPVAQQIVQKTVSCNSLRDVKVAVYVGVSIYIYVNIIGCLLGLCLGAFYENCDPLQKRLTLNPIQLLPLFVMDILSDFYGLAGLFCAGVLIASISTTSSGISAVSASILEDFMQSYKPCHISATQARFMAQPIVLVYGLLCLFGTYIASRQENLLQIGLTTVGLVMSPVFGVFTLGLFFPKANAKGAICGLFGSILLVTAIFNVTNTSDHSDVISTRCVSNCAPGVFPNITSKGQKSEESGIVLLKMSYMWFSPIATTSCILIGLIVSGITGFENPYLLDPALCVSVADDIFPFYYLPDSIRRRMRAIDEPTARQYHYPSVVGNVTLGRFVSSAQIPEWPRGSTEIGTDGSEFRERSLSTQHEGESSVDSNVVSADGS